MLPAPLAACRLLLAVWLLALPSAAHCSLLAAHRSPNAKRLTLDASRRLHCSLLTAHYLPLTTHYSLLTTLYSLLTAHCSQLTTHCSLLTAHCSLLTAYCTLLAAYCSLLTTHCSPLTARCSLLSTHFRLASSLLSSCIHTSFPYVYSHLLFTVDVSLDVLLAWLSVWRADAARQVLAVQAVDIKW